MSFPLFQKEDETEESFKVRIFEGVSHWVPHVAESDIPTSGPVRNVWNNVKRTREMTDAQLYEEIWDMSHCDDISSDRWWGAISRSWLELLKLEDSRRRGARK